MVRIVICVGFNCKDWGHVSLLVPVPHGGGEQCETSKNVGDDVGNCTRHPN